MFLSLVGIHRPHKFFNVSVYNHEIPTVPGDIERERETETETMGGPKTGLLLNRALLVSVLCLSFVLISHSAPEGALITDLPGFNGSFPSKHYSGYWLFYFNLQLDLYCSVFSNLLLKLCWSHVEFSGVLSNPIVLSARLKWSILLTDD